MDSRNYQAFLAVAELGSFSKAAEVLFITQPAVSKRIASLEQWLGHQLFDRAGHSILLNESGRTLLPMAQRIIRDIEESKQVLANLEGTVSGHLSLVTSHHIGLRRLPATLQQFNRQYAGIKLDLAFMDSEDACQRIEKGDFEMGIVTLPIKASGQLKLTPIWQDTLCIAAAPDHPLLQQDNVTLADLAEHRAILPSRGTYTRSIIEGQLVQQQRVLDVVLETNYLETIRMMVSVGLGWSALPRTMLANDLQEVPLKELNMVRTLGLVQHAQRGVSSASRAFIDLLQLAATHTEKST